MSTPIPRVGHLVAGETKPAVGAAFITPAVYGVPTSEPGQDQHIVHQASGEAAVSFARGLQDDGLSLAGIPTRKTVHFSGENERSLAERSVRHDYSILRGASELVLPLAAASRLVPCPVRCGLGLLQSLGQEMAQTLARRISCR